MIRHFADRYRWLSNFAEVTVVFDGLIFPSVEHAYVSAKCDDPKFKMECSQGNFTAGQIKRKGRKVALTPRWNEKMKIYVMTHLLIQKFHKEPYRTYLINTGEQHIQEGNTWGDTFWGVELHSGNGCNHLGKIIMEIRNELIMEFKNTSNG